MAEKQAEPAGSVWARRIAEAPGFSSALGWGPGQVLESFWRDVFRSMPPGAQVLEIGCGSGEVALWAAEAGRGLKITATDVVEDLRPAGGHPDVRFIGGAPAEALPLPADAFDLVTSNFGVEYAERGPAFAELARVMKPGGRGALVLHRADSTITQTSRYLIETDALLTRFDIPGRLHRAAALRPDHLTRRKLLKDVLKHRADIPAPVNPQFTAVAYFDLAEQLLKGDRAAREALARLEEVLGFRLEMAREQVRAALDPSGLADIARRLAAHGVAMQPSEISCTYPNGEVEKVGWIALLAKQPA